ncbi:MurR/RpiR family transcriptional regulator [Variovorax sp. CAN2819]|uniref:MurR/RpiR family transcriptional regulator n=1 Tax=Variovorax sp. CAN15 TaxID=3046727 RepID=UPI0026484D0D|nr:MurR/RpiR family transcriptional regulator [Variovorax sp. CAN15]MDN6883387.1 MurR/RpiR family transcriptional regulator [Variovorax sp. CAN15]
MSTTFDSPGTTVAQRIAQALPRLSRSHRQVADYVLEHPLQVATLPIDELAAVVGVSVATANRFARALDFDGYATFRAELVRGFEPLVAPVERLRGNLERPTTVAEVFATALDESRRNIDATRQTLDYAACEAAVERIGKARSVYIGGFGASAWLAGLLQHGLDGSCSDVRMLSSVSGVTHAARTLMHAGPQDVFIGLTFPRYLTDTISLAQIARGQGCAVIALTDRPSSPLAPLADVALFCQTETSYRPNCETSVLALIEALTSAVSLRAPDPVQSAGRILHAVRPWLHGANGLPRINGNAAAPAHTPDAPAPGGAGSKKKKASR